MALRAKLAAAIAAVGIICMVTGIGLTYRPALGPALIVLGVALVVLGLLGVEVAKDRKR